jgi:hypothetical protein
MTTLIENTKLSDQNCAWCDARKGKDVHSKACPLGERYKQVQQLGGVPVPKEAASKKQQAVVHDEITRCLTCAKEVEPYTLDCDECMSKYTSAVA